MFTLTATEAAALDAAEGLLIPTHIVTCASDGSVVCLTEGPFGRCACEVLTDWMTSNEADHICRDCQADLDWSAPVPLTLLFVS